MQRQKLFVALDGRETYAGLLQCKLEGEKNEKM